MLPLTSTSLLFYLSSVSLALRTLFLSGPRTALTMTTLHPPMTTRLHTYILARAHAYDTQPVLDKLADKARRACSPWHSRQAIEQSVYQHHHHSTRQFVPVSASFEGVHPILIDFAGRLNLVDAREEEEMELENGERAGRSEDAEDSSVRDLQRHSASPRQPTDSPRPPPSTRTSTPANTTPTRVSSDTWLPEIYQFHSVGLGIEDRYNMSALVQAKQQLLQQQHQQHSPGGTTIQAAVGVLPSSPRIAENANFNFEHGALALDLSETSFMAWF